MSFPAQETFVNFMLSLNTATHVGCVSVPKSLGKTRDGDWVPVVFTSDGTPCWTVLDIEGDLVVAPNLDAIDRRNEEARTP